MKQAQRHKGTEGRGTEAQRGGDVKIQRGGGKKVQKAQRKKIDPLEGVFGTEKNLYRRGEG